MTGLASGLRHNAVMTEMDPEVLLWSEALAQADAIRSGRVTALELTELQLARIDRYDSQLRAYVSLDRDGARAAAEAADAAIASGESNLSPLLGVTISVKDLIDVAGLPTTHSSKVLSDNVATDDDPLIQRFRAAGLTVIGKTNLPEFSTTMTDSELNGTCRNPWDLNRTAGGSSGGAAAAVSAALCAVAHGTDGAGSVRSPASFCGVVGLKTTRGLVSFGPELRNPYYGTTGDGLLTRSVRDAAALLDVFVGRTTNELAWSPRPNESYLDQLSSNLPRLRIAVTTDAPFGETTSECAAAADDAAQALQAAGHTIETATPRWDLLLAVSAFPMQIPGAAALVPSDRLGDVEPRNRPMIERLAHLTVLEHANALQHVRQAACTFLEFWDTYDVLLSPTAGIVAPSVDFAPWHQEPDAHMATFATFPNFAQPFNLSGQPAVSVPTHWTNEGLPVGVQLAGRRLDEARLLQLAHELELARPWNTHRPPLH
jgi:amidase